MVPPGNVVEMRSGTVDALTPDVKQCVMQLFLSPQIKGQVLSDSQLVRTRCNNGEYKYRVLNWCKKGCMSTFGYSVPH